MRRFPFLLAAACALAAPAAAHAQLPEDVERLEHAIVELHDAKRSAAGEVGAERRAMARALKRCKGRGPGWRRIRSVRIASQRDAYARGARRLWAELSDAARERAAMRAYEPAFERFLERFERPLADPALQGGIDSIRRRLAYQRDASKFASCRTFEKQLKRVRQFKPSVTADYLAGSIHVKLVRYVGNRRKAAVRRHWPPAQERALEAAVTRFRELGGDEGRSTYLRFGAYSLDG